MQLPLTVTLAGLALLCTVKKSQPHETTALKDALYKDIVKELKKKHDEGGKFSVDEAKEELKEAVVKAALEHKKWLDHPRPDQTAIKKVIVVVLNRREVKEAFTELLRDDITPRAAGVALMGVAGAVADRIHAELQRNSTRGSSEE